MNEAPNNNDATHVANNVRLTTMDTQQFSMAASYIVIMQKKLTYGRRGIVTQKLERFVQTEINFVLGKNGDHRPSSLGSRLIVVVSE